MYPCLQFLRWWPLVPLVLLWLVGCTPLKITLKNAPVNEHYTYFPNDTVQPATQSFQFHWPETRPWQSLVLDSLQFEYKGKKYHFAELARKGNNFVTLLIHRDTVKFAHFGEGFDRNSTVTTFSVAKAIVNTLVYCAIADGYIASDSVPITDFLPELADNDPNFRAVKLWHLLQMNHGLKLGTTRVAFYWEAVRLYYNSDLRKHALSLKTREAPGRFFRYRNSSTQLLAILLERATGKPLAEYFEQGLWQKMGTEGPLYWSKDQPGPAGIPKAFCCMNARAEDLAKYGRLYLKRGKFRGEQVVPNIAVEHAYHQRFRMRGRPEYNAHWMRRDRVRDPILRVGGLYGQMLYLYPSEELIIVSFSDANPLRLTGWRKLDLQLLEKIAQRLSPENIPYQERK